VTFSYRQILASAAGAVIAALIASSFGVAGTIVGVAIGSMAATMGTALVAQSIERGQKVVKQAVVRVPEGPTSTLLRRMGGTGAAGGATSSVDGGRKEPEPTEVAGAVGEETTEMEPTAAFVNATERVDVPAAEADAPVTARFGAETVPLPPTSVAEGAGVVGVTGGVGVAATATAEEARGRRFTWKAFAGTAAIVFVLALGVVTAVELLANRPTVFTPSSPPASTTTTTSTPATTSTSTSTPTSSTTTSTSAPSSTTTSTSAPSSTSTTNVLKSTTTTTAAAAPAP
jgi:hypothetical protein